MDVVYVRSYARPAQSAPQGLEIPSPFSPKVLSAISANAVLGDGAARRTWQVSIRINNHPAAMASITDPFVEAEYKNVEDYLRNSDRPRWSAQSLALEENETDDFFGAENRIKEYGEALVAQLGLNPGMLSAGVTEAQVFVVEHHDAFADGPNNLGGVHCLAWELLESVKVPRLPKLRLRVTRVSDFPGRQHQAPKIPQPLATVQSNPSAVFHVLLVIARDFSRSGAERDPEPDLAQWPLMIVQKKLRSRMLLEVVRPGSREELEAHLRQRFAHGVQFNLVHFDLHGRIMRDENNNQVPWLLFAKRHQSSTSHGYQVPQTNLAKADAVAELLARYKIENVVLNACLSAYNRAGPTTNLAHIFLKHGIQNVSAMWFYVHWQTVATYLETFYNELLIKCCEFHVAAQKGRDAIRKKPTRYQDFFLCVNYTRREHRTNTIPRDPSPSPSAQSGDSSTSNNSAKSFMSGVWKPSTPRLSDSLLLGDEPVMRLKLHLLELEYKLMTFRIVYASDLRRAKSDLNTTIERMVNMWLSTNLIDDVFYYKAKDFAKRKLLTDTVSYREKRTRASNGGYLQLLFPRPVRPLRQTLHIIRDVDQVVDPGYQADELENQRSEERRFLAQEGLQRFAQKLHGEGHSYLLFLGSQDAQWWRTYLQHLNGEWWLHMPWNFTVHSRYVRDVRLPSEKRKQTPRAVD